MAEFLSPCKTKKILENNQYPSSFCEPLIAKSLENCYGKDNNSEEKFNEEEKPRQMVQIQYRGKSQMITAGHYDTYMPNAW